MAIIRKNDLRKMSAKELETKIDELERSLLEAEGEGKVERRKPLKKTIAKLKTLLHSQKTLNTTSAPKNITKNKR